MMKALIYKEKVVQIAEEEFLISPSLIWVDADNSVAVGDIYDGTFTKPPIVEPKVVISLEEVNAKVDILIDYCLGNITKEALSTKVINVRDTLKNVAINKS